MSVAAVAIPEREKTSLPSGRLGMWWFLAGELVIFGGLIACYVLYRLKHADWAEHAAHVLWQAGAVNTIVLLTSSLTIVLAFRSVDEGNYKKAANQMALTIAIGFLFVVIKTFEYSHEIQAGITPKTNLFWSFYFLMTGLHALHVVAGLVAIAVVMIGVRKGQNLQRVEYVGLYWHLVDVIWIFLFPLLYIASG